jgi:pimeloyl-ACP methyl ester carboxylesterase
MLFWITRIGLILLVLTVAGLVAERIAEALDDRRFPPPGRLVDIGGGRALHLVCEGSAGPVIVVEQGAGEPAMMWRSLQMKAAGFARLCLYDRAGYGWSPPAPAWQNIDERAADLHRLLEAAGLPGPYILAAHSYGGLVVRAFARAYPKDTAGLVMVDAIEESIAFHPDYLRFIGQSRPIVTVMRGAAALGIMRLVGLMGGGEAARDEADREGQRLAGAVAARPAFYAAIAGDLRSIEEASTRYPLPEGMGGLGDMPVIVLTHGQPFPGPFARLEPFWRPGQERMARLTSQGELIVAEKSNHMIMHDQPDLVLDALRAMVAKATR